MKTKEIAILGILTFATIFLMSYVFANVIYDYQEQKVVEKLESINAKLIVENNKLNSMLEETVLDSFANFESEDDDYVIYRKSDLMELVKKVANLQTEQTYLQSELDRIIKSKSRKISGGGSSPIIPYTGGVS